MVAKINSTDKTAENKSDPNDKDGDGKIDKEEFDAMSPEQQDQYEDPDMDGIYTKKQA
jgi:hypothetical protein